MIVEDNEQEVLERLEHPENLVNKLQIRRKHEGQGRKEGDVNIPSLIKEVAAEAKVMGGSGREIGKALGISQPSVTDSARGLVGRRLDRELLSHVQDVKKERIEALKGKKDAAHEKALDGLLESLDIVNEEMKPVETVDGLPGVRNLKRIKAATSIAADLARVSGALTGKEEGGNNVRALIIEVPPQKQLNQYAEVVINASS